MCSICRRSPHSPRCPAADEPGYPRCPVCGSAAETFYTGRDGRLIGCEHCVIPANWYEIANINTIWED